MEDIGGKLRAARFGRRFTLREVEERSQRLAQQWGKPSYRISASWLARVEAESGSLSATKLIVLAVIYDMTAEQLLGLCPNVGFNPCDSESISSPNSTLLLESGRLEDHAKLWLPDRLVTDQPPEATTLLPQADSMLPAHYRRGIIGRRDRTLEPMILAGSIVLIDTQKRTIANRKEWNHEFDRPIYFLLTRTGFLSGFCELDRQSEWLTLVPHLLSPEASQRWRYKKEVEVIGTVAAALIRRAA